MATSKAFIIGDKDKGLTIVLTDPIMLLHYTKGDLEDERVSESTDRPGQTRSAIVREFFSLFRNVDMDQAEADLVAFNKDGAAAETVYEIDSLKTELNYANEIARALSSGTEINEVDFCLAFDVDVSVLDASVRARSLDPARAFLSYIKKAHNLEQKKSGIAAYIAGKVAADLETTQKDKIAMHPKDVRISAHDLSQLDPTGPIKKVGQ